MEQTMHFTRGSTLMHATYKLLQGRSGPYWLKQLETENVCNCTDREEDRKALLGIELVEGLTFLQVVKENQPTYLPREPE